MCVSIERFWPALRPRESAELRVFLSLWVFFTRRCLRSLRTLGACVVCEREWTVVSVAYEILSSLKTEQHANATGHKLDSKASANERPKDGSFSFCPPPCLMFRMCVRPVVVLPWDLCAAGLWGAVVLP